MSEPDVTPILRPLGTDEYLAPARTDVAQRAADGAHEDGTAAAARTATSPRRYWASRRGTAAGLLALNDATGGTYFEVPGEAALDDAAAEEAFAADPGPVVDVQTHWIGDKPALHAFQEHVFTAYRHQAPDWWSGLDGVAAYTMAEYLRCVFVESDTDVAVISATPGNTDGDMILSNPEMAGMRELFDRLAGTGRLLNHTVVRPNGGDTERMHEWEATYRPVGWKVYTLGQMSDRYVGFEPGSEWRLDDERVGLPFLEQVRATGVHLVCAHKGVSGLVASGSPADVGPAARAFPDVDFVIYHSGYEPGSAPEGPYAGDGAVAGVDRLIDSVRAAGLGPGDNVYAELGTTWFNLISRPLEAAHVLGKLLVHLGEDNVVWGTDAIWYGPTQPVLDAFRTFQIPDAICEEFGYPKISAAAKRKIVAGTAARLYGVDLERIEGARGEDVLGWTTSVLQDYERFGLVKA